ncbi:GFA family protein [Planktotalea sp.]|uniref:GFA family protein n=1 Tax=Planktotalea sp. TaxID=2029877 RepID=UPI00329995EF
MASQYRYKGACLCGAVQVRLTSTPLLTLACHCDGCQKFSAGAFTLTAMFPKQNFSCSGAVEIGGLRSEGRAHFFCAACKVFVYSELSGAPDRVNVRTSILENGASLEPFVEVMTDEKLPWVYVPAVHSFSKFPKSVDVLHALMDEYSKHQSVTE